MNVIAAPKIALSIKQPWAWLICCAPAEAAKDVENRDWPTSYRGPFLIHASKTFDQQGYEWVRVHFPEIRMPAPHEFETGGVVGRSELIDCVKHHTSKWFFGSFGFVLKDSKPLTFMRARGMPGFFNLTYPTI